MYPLPTGTLPITGVNLIAFTLAGAAFLIVGAIALRLVFFLKRRTAAGAAALAPGRRR
jgi:uncharacterized membrane-anchored protein